MPATHATRAAPIAPAPALVRELADEVPVALVYDGESLAVMLASPHDLVDFATGFTLTEGIANAAPEVVLVEHPNGIECRMTLDGIDALAVRRRHRATTGGTSCGLCGVRSLAEAVRAPASVDAASLRLSARDVCASVQALRDHQPLHDRTRATHAAGLLLPGQGLVAVREDVGRHNALDKLVGAAVRGGWRGTDSTVVLTSRVSIEMVQKSAALGSGAIVAVSAPTALAVRAARAAGITLIGNVRGERFDVFTHPWRLAADTNGTRTA